MTTLFNGARLQVLGTDGKPLAFGTVTTYAAGTTTLKTAYSDSQGTVPLSNPFTLDAYGQADVRLDGSYKILIKDANGVTLPGYPVDYIPGAQDLGDQVNVFGYMTSAQIADVQSRGRTLDVSAAINACLAASGGRRVYFPKGTYLVGSTLYALTDTQIVGESRDECTIQRTAAHTGNTLEIGSETPGLHAGAYLISNIGFNRDLVFSPGNTTYIPGTSTGIVNRLTGGQAHVVVHHGQRGCIEHSTFSNMPYHVDYIAGSVSVMKECHFSGSIWDQLTAGLQEGLAQVRLRKASSGEAPTLMAFFNNYFGGGFASPVRAVTIGAIVSNYAYGVSSKFGLLVESVEGLVVDGGYFGGHNASNIEFVATSGDICTQIDISNVFFDGGRVNSIHFDNTNAGGNAIMVTVSGNTFNGQTVTNRAIEAAASGGGPSVVAMTLVGNVMQAHLYTPIYLWGAYGVVADGNIVAGYNTRGGNTGDPAGAAGAYVVGSATCDKIKFSDNAWGGATNSLSSTNNCQYGAYFGGSFTTEPDCNGDANNGLGLAGGALVTGAKKSVKAPTLINAWVNYGGGFRDAGYYKDGDGVVHLQGLIKTGAIGTAAFQLPAGYRPSASINFNVTSNAAFGQVVVTGAGAVTPTVGSSTYVSLEGVSFMADQ